MPFATDAPDLMSVLFGGGAVAVVAALGKLLEWWFTRKDKKEQDVIEHFRKLLEREKEECDAKIEDLTRRDDERAKQLDRLREDVAGFRDKLSEARARIRYLEEKARDKGIRVDPWDAPPAADTDTHKPLGG